MPTYAFSGGDDSTPGWGQRNRVRFVGTWAVGDSWSINLVTNTEGDITLGEGNLEGAAYNYALVHADRVYIANGSFWSFSAILDPTGWEQQNVGAGFQAFTTSYGTGDSAISLAVTQGRVAVFGRRNIQIWNVDANPASFSRAQVIQNAGTIASESVQSIGELDVLYLDDTGVRSLRTKETTLNAYVDDVGSAIDATLQGVFSELSVGQVETCVSIVEPESKRYWLYVPNKTGILGGTIYVLSKFPSSKIQAWSTYIPGMRCDRFMLYNNQVLIKGRATGTSNNARLYLYGGLDGVTYDTSIPTVDLPWIDLQTPGKVKQACGLQAAFKGNWQIYASMNPTAGSMVEVVNRGSAVTPNSLADSTYDIGHFNYQASGNHIHLKAVGVAAAEAQTLSMLTLQYNEAHER